MDVNVNGKVAVVTGGTAGIGLAIVETFLREGAKVAFCSRNQENVEKTVHELRSKGYEVYGESVDVASKQSLMEFANRVEEQFGGLDIWVSNAGIYPQYKATETPEDVWDQVMATNLKSVYVGGVIANEKLRKRGGGVLINAASFASLMPSVGSGAYAASKAGVYNLTKTLAAELAPFNIRVNGFIPGVIETNLTSSAIENRGDEMVNQIALKRFGTSQEVANAVLFLCSDQASYITGTFIEISGGKFCVQNP